MKGGKPNLVWNDSEGSWGNGTWSKSYRRRGICLVINGKQVISEEISLREDPE